MDDTMRRADRRARIVLARQKEADKRSKEVVRRIEKGDANPRPLPGMREDSMGSMDSTASMDSSRSLETPAPAEPLAEVSADASTDETTPAEEAGGDLAHRVTKDTGSQGDPHAHNEQKFEEMTG